MLTNITRMAVVFIFVLVSAASSRAQMKQFDLGGIVVTVSESRTAQVFHFVDQMSDWDAAVHHSYVRWAKRTLKIGPDETRLLEKHAAMRRVRGWGGGFEQAFYVEDTIEVAARKAVSSKLLSSDEAEAEKEILLHFEPMVRDEIDRGSALVNAFEARMRAEIKRTSRIVKQLVRFSETKEVLRIPLFLVPNPESGNGGGGYNGGRLVVEISTGLDPMPVLLHEVAALTTLASQGCDRCCRKNPRDQLGRP